MSWPYLLMFAFVASQAAAMFMLSTSGLYSEMFGRYRRIARSHDSARLLQKASSNEWVENHEFWEMAEVEEIAF